MVLRLNPNTDAKTLSQISTGKKENKFGVNKKIFLQLVNYLKKSKYLKFKMFKCSYWKSNFKS